MSGGFSVGVNNQLTTNGTYNHAYDDEGNITQRTKISDGWYTVYGWDHRNRLISVSYKTSGHVTTQAVTHSYDAFNRLMKRTFQIGGGSPTTEYFIHDGNQIVLELQSDGDVNHRLLWGTAVDEALADEDGVGTTYWYLTDNLGSVRDIATYNATTDTTTVANHIAYDSFGQRKSETNSALGDFDLGYTGKWFDRATGLQWNINRWYNAEIGRWMSEDPIGFAAGDANMARYVRNEATWLVDPDGKVEGEPGEKAGAALSWLRRHIPQSSYQFQFSGLPYEIRTKYHDACNGTSAREFLHDLREMHGFSKRTGRKVEYLIIKGHGTEFSILDDAGHSIILIEGKRVMLSGTEDLSSKTDITDMLRDMTGNTSTIDLRACDAGDEKSVAQRLSKILGNGTRVRGFTIPAPGIPWSNGAFGPKQDYINGEKDE